MERTAVQAKNATISAIAKPRPIEGLRTLTSPYNSSLKYTSVCPQRMYAQFRFDRLTPYLRRIPARLIGIGFRPEHITLR
jgi:hypothetical protein